MARLVATEYVSLDGVFEEPGVWSGPFFNDEAGKFKFDELMASERQLMGRLTYEGFAKAWPTFKDEQGFADKMNGMPKFVVSSTLENPTWNNTTVIGGDIPAEIAKLKAADGDILLAGSGRLLRLAMGHDLVDEYRFMLHPIVLGKGKRLFDDGMDTRTLKLVDTKTLATGVTILTYEPQGAKS
ncbi:MAG: hypothetical protein QOE92_2480 [Chloroflexota bacterium]|jgi:dihydrofolate reductase|nr:hypothetical protein [Chloroflexota bacterium]